MRFIFFAFLLLVCTKFSFTLEETFDFECRPQTPKCFSESAPKGTLFLGQIIQRFGEPKSFLLITDGDRSVILEKKDQPEYSFRFVSNSEGTLEICFQNNDIRLNHYYLSLKTGKEAENAIEPAQKQDITPLVKYIDHVYQTVESIKSVMQMNIRQSEGAVGTEDRFSSLLKYLSIIVILCTGIFSCVQFYCLKSFLKKKKVL